MQEDETMDKALAKETQVVFFTHHKHLITLAESSVSDEVLRVHEL
jgi:uncharacterized protein YhaN